MSERRGSFGNLSVANKSSFGESIWGQFSEKNVESKKRKSVKGDVMRVKLENLTDMFI